MSRRASIKEIAGQHVKRGKGKRLSAEKRKFWRDFWNVKVTEIDAFISGFEVKTDVLVDDDAPLYVRFNLRPKQSFILTSILEMWEEERSARLVILKGRRQGCSIFLAALFLERILRIPGWEGMLVAQDMDTSRYLFEKIDEFLDQIPAEALQANGLTILSRTKEGVRIQHGSHKVSQIRVMTARRRALGRGRGNNGIAATEFPVWPVDAKADMSGILPTCRDVPGNIVVFESTAHGFEEFRDRYYAAKQGKSGYRAIFLSAQDHPDARRPLETEREYDVLEDSIGTRPDLDLKNEIEVYERVKTEFGGDRIEALQFINWRRFVLHDECGGSIELLRREYPTTESEAFQGSGRPVFPLAYINSHMELAQAREEAAQVVSLSYGNHQIEVEPDKHAKWTMFEPPIEGEAYTFFSDVAAGYERQSDGKKEADRSTCKIKHILTGRTVARLQGHIFPTDLAHEIFKGALLYGKAKGYIERNMDGGTVISAMEELEWGGVRGYELLLTVPRIVRMADGRRGVEREVGFKTSMKTRPKLIDAVLQHLRDHSPPRNSTPFDIRTLKEMMRFERDEKGRMEAATGFDDLVIDEGGSLLACRELRDEVPVLSKVVPRMSHEEAAYDMIFRHKHQSEYGSPAGAGHPDLGPDF